MRIFDYDSKYVRTKMDCEKFHAIHKKIRTKGDSINLKEDKLELIEYQKKLLQHGYKIEPN